MARTGARGRPIEPLVLSTQERTYLERQVRRHRVARSLSERCSAMSRGTCTHEAAAPGGTVVV